MNRSIEPQFYNFPIWLQVSGMAVDCEMLNLSFDSESMVKPPDLSDCLLKLFVLMTVESSNNHLYNLDINS